MAAIHDLLAQVQDEALRNRLEQEINRLTKTKKFGLVFEEHLPECTPLYDISVKRGSTVAKKTGAVSEMYEVYSIKDGIATCYHKVTEEKEEIPLDELVCVAQFGEPIYPYLKPIDSVCNAPDSDLWHTLIEADNYHALQLLEYLYAGKVDCIYIDPPYNTGARDWKYNNDYVDSSDSYRHSKWLSMMEKRLRLAKKLLNPNDSVLIVTIDEKEYLHLGCLLEELFPETIMQMITSVINPKGVRRENEFSRCEEYLFVLLFGNARVSSIGNSMLRTMIIEKENQDPSLDNIRWKASMRSASSNGRRKDRPNLFYPIIVSAENGNYLRVGDSLPENMRREDYQLGEGEVAIWPIGARGEELTWSLQPESFRTNIKKGYIKFGPWNGKTRVPYHLTSGQIKDVEAGVLHVVGKTDEGALIIRKDEETSANSIRPFTVWNQKSHSASEQGSGINSVLLPDRVFPFPKSLYATEDTLRFFVGNKPNALIVDFFAGSGTTAHAVLRLNHQDGGHRRCIVVTNNEVSEEDVKQLKSSGYQQGDPEWEKHGICRHITIPRITAAITGVDSTGNRIDSSKKYGIKRQDFVPDEENILVSKETKKSVRSTPYKKITIQDPSVPDPFPMSDGFAANIAFFKLAFLDKTSVAIGRQLAELFPVLWLKAGAHGVCPSLRDMHVSMQVLPENQFAILIDEKHFHEFKEEVDKHSEIHTIYIITDSEPGYREMISGFSDMDCYQLYRDYLDNVRINTGRIS